MVDLSSLVRPQDWLVFAVATFVLNTTPGVDLLLTVSRTVQAGARAGAAAALGIAAGCTVYALAAAFGLAALLALHPGGLRAVQWVGAAYLAWLGAVMLRAAWRGSPAAAPAAARADPAPSGWTDFRRGALTNLLNPKIALFFLAFLPQFVPAATPSPTVSLLLLGLWFVAQSALFLLALVALAARLRRLSAHPVLRRLLAALGGSLFIALALRLVSERPVPG